MYINAKTQLTQYHPIKNPQNPGEDNGRQTGQSLPTGDRVSISPQAKELAELDARRFHQESDGSRALAYGDLIYVGPPDLSLDEARARMDLYDKYQNTPIMDSFRKSAIKLYESETKLGTADQEIGKKLMVLYEDLHKRLSRLDVA